MNDKIKKLKELANINEIYKDYLYDEGDVRPLNKLLKKNGFKPLGELKVRLKDTLDNNYKECEGKTYTIDGFCRWASDDIIFFVDEIDGEFDFYQIEEII